jgi:hypothetical protein
VNAAWPCLAALAALSWPVPGQEDWTVVVERRLVGAEDRGRFGFAVAVGDVDSDGWPEFFVGAPGADEDRGLVRVFDGETLELLVEFRGEQPGDRLGAALAAPDWSADGASDLAVGAPGWNEGRGAVYVATRLRKDEPEWSRIVGGERAGDGLGTALAPATGKGRDADLNGIVVGAPGYDARTGEDAGRAVVLVRGRGKVPVESRFQVEGPAPGARLGEFVGSVGGFLREPIHHVSVGVPFALDSDGSEVGQLRVLDGRDGKQLFACFGASAAARCGSGAASVVLHGRGMQYDELLVADTRGARLFGAAGGALRKTLRVSDRPGDCRLSASVRIATDLQYAFAVAHLPFDGPGEGSSLTIYSGEGLEPLARIERPRNDECGRAMAVWQWGGAATGRFVVGAPGAEGGAGAVEVLRLDPPKQ